MSYFGIKYINYDVDVGELETAVRQEMAGPCKLLGYRSLHKKMRKMGRTHAPSSVVFKYFNAMHVTFEYKPIFIYVNLTH
jgi:hypothetical protein